MWKDVPLTQTLLSQQDVAPTDCLEMSWLNKQLTVDKGTHGRTHTRTITAYNRRRLDTWLKTWTNKQMIDWMVRQADELHGRLVETRTGLHRSRGFGRRAPGSGLRASCFPLAAAPPSSAWLAAVASFSLPRTARRSKQRVLL
jgi:hypothetical protein